MKLEPRLQDRLRLDCDDIRVVAYLRNHAEYARSALQQLQRMGYEADDVIARARGAAGMVVLGVVPDYARRLDMWRDVFGRASVQIYDYDGLVADGVPIQQHFCDTVLQDGLFARLTDGDGLAPRANEAFSHPAAYVLNRMSQTQPLRRDGRPNPGFVFNRQSWLSHIRGAAMSLPVELEAVVQGAIAADAELFVAMAKLHPVAPKVPDFVKTADQMFAGNIMLDDLAQSLESAVAAATSSLAREKFFASLPKLRRPKLRPAAMTQMHLALFLLPDLTRLTSCAGLLLHADEPDLARAFASMAMAFGTPTPALVDLMQRIAAAMQPAPFA